MELEAEAERERQEAEYNTAEAIARREAMEAERLRQEEERKLSFFPLLILPILCSISLLTTFLTIIIYL